MEPKQLATEAATLALKWLEAGGQLAQQEAPKLAHEIVMWGIVQPIFISIGLAIGALIGSYALYLTWWATKDAEDTDRGMMRVVAAIVLGILIVTMLIFIPFTLTDAAKPYFAPRLYVIEQLRSATK